ncbi:hypothetical protein GCM10012284_48620 [Mangrovihabitans endophyticus]|uniref:Aromatic amino acid beta-eliminating lyase/threonine aldolase domain-containing protein n=2 Tax=Mangrovihabitans endophyticus TaxID=1751298 RepID=A0A8J3C291_9ACTN|nr:hypothetical protein GCM10012284_48620 [Mangrovihabitans endophyticus]
MDDEIRARRAACTDSFLGNGLIRPADLLAAIGSDVEPDVYGEGGVVRVLEHHIADLLGKPAAVFLPSGTMAQAATLRVHAEQRSRRTVCWHPYCHLPRHEGGGYARLHGLIGREVGEPDRVIESRDLGRVAEPPAALVLELPQRDLGGMLPDWDDLVAQTTWARENGAAAHLDGARLWEATAGYGKPPSVIAELFDTVYVSFYKGVGALPGCCVAGTTDVVAQVREWRSRMGGTLHAMWPAAGSALTLLPGALAEMPVRMAHAQAIAAALATTPGVRVVPDPPQTPMMNVLFETTADRFAAHAERLAVKDGLWVWPRPVETGVPGVVRAELAVGRGTLSHTPDFVASTLGMLAG